MKYIHIIGEQSSGLAVDSRIIAATLSKTTFQPKVRKVGLGRVNGLIDRIIPQSYWRLFPHRSPFINIFCEQIFEKWMDTAKINILIPNQEWCRSATFNLLAHMDYIFCKTHFAEEIFNNIGCNTKYIGFTSEDHYDGKIEKNFRKFLHVAGKSKQKGTVSLARTWSRHPEWPTLTIVTHEPALISKYFASNINVECQIPIERLWLLQNECGVHLCLSEAEGFGHVINEGLACGAVVVTTNAPPMYELVKPEFGFLVEYASSSPQSLGINYYIDEEALEFKVNGILRMDAKALAKLGSLARISYIKSKENFQWRINEEIRRIS